MFFFEWLIPFLIILAVGVAVLYFALRNRSGAGIRTDGREPDTGPDDDLPRT